MTSRESAIVLAKALDSKKGMEIKVLKTEELTTWRTTSSSVLPPHHPDQGPV